MSRLETTRFQTQVFETRFTVVSLHSHSRLIKPSNRLAAIFLFIGSIFDLTNLMKTYQIWRGRPGCRAGRVPVDQDHPPVQLGVREEVQVRPDQRALREAAVHGRGPARHGRQQRGEAGVGAAHQGQGGAQADLPQGKQQGEGARFLCFLFCTTT